MAQAIAEVQASAAALRDHSAICYKGEAPPQFRVAHNSPRGLLRLRRQSQRHWLGRSVGPRRSQPGTK